MTNPTRISLKSLRLPTIRSLIGPKLDLGQRLSDAMRADARAIASTYLVALGQKPDASVARERRRRQLDY